MRRLRLAVHGLGRLGRACAEQIQEDPELVLAGVVRRGEHVARSETSHPARVPVAGHFADLERLDAVLVCLPPDRTEGGMRELLQAGVAAVECARFPEEVRPGYRQRLASHAERHRVPAATEAGWDPGLLSVFRAQFGFLVPHGHTEERHRPGEALHRSASVPEMVGVRDAVALSLPQPQGGLQHYVYVELAPGVDAESVAARLRGDPFWAGEEVRVFPVPSVAELEATGDGVVLDRRGRVGQRAHQHLLLEARCSEADLAARVMVGTAQAIRDRSPGVYTPLDLPPAGLRR